MKRVEIIATGNELLTGQVENTTTPFLVNQLQTCGYEIIRTSTVRDNLEEIKSAICEALGRADLIVVTGGLGPTPDDVTREAIAESIQMPLEFRSELWEEIQAYFKRRGKETPPSNINQAYIPYGAIALPNPLGTAPGIVVNFNSKIILALPGPPEELRQMFLKEVKPFLFHNVPHTRLYLKRCFKVCGIGETVVLERLKRILDKARNTSAKFSFLPRAGEVYISLQVSADEPVLFEELEKEIQQALGEDLFGIDEETLPGKVAELMRSSGLTLGVAESCTGGLIMNYLTDVPGSSEYLRGGIVAYQNEVKLKHLGVKPETLEKFTEVSPNTAMEMAEGIRRLFNSDIGLATTGFAGPTGGLPDAPIGTVYVALSTSQESFYSKLFYPGLGRVTVKTLAAKAALDLLRRYIMRSKG
ncbi:MAG: competence/damage-inducible protein A [Thermacetogeniaceae bacterium]